MTLRNLGALVVLAALVARPLPAAERCASTDACLRQIEAAQRDTQSIAADFEQVKHVSLLDKPLVSRGRFVFKRPDRMRLQIVEPQPATVIINGREMLIPNLSERERQAMAMAPVAGSFTQLGAIFTGSTRVLQEGFDVNASADGDAIAVKLVPRQERWARLFKTIAIRFGGPHLMAQTIRLDDPLGDYLEITLRNAERNGDVPDALFEKGTE